MRAPPLPASLLVVAVFAVFAAFVAPAARAAGDGPADREGSPSLRHCAVISESAPVPFREDIEGVSVLLGATSAVEALLARESVVARVAPFDFASGRDNTAPAEQLRRDSRCDTQVAFVLAPRAGSDERTRGLDVTVRRFESPASASTGWRGHYDLPLGRSESVDPQAGVAMRRRIATDLLASGFFDALKGPAVSPEALRAEYDAFYARTTTSKIQLHVRHILLTSESDAKRALARIVDGHEPFEDVAREVSKDPGSAPQGGDLDWTAPDSYVPAFARAIERAAPRGMVPGVVRTQFGWHVVEVLGERPNQDLDFENVKDRLVAGVRWRLVTQGDSRRP